jgi:hypothetical protein
MTIPRIRCPRSETRNHSGHCTTKIEACGQVRIVPYSIAAARASYRPAIDPFGQGTCSNKRWWAGEFAASRATLAAVSPIRRVHPRRRLTPFDLLASGSILFARLRLVSRSSILSPEGTAGVEAQPGDRIPDRDLRFIPFSRVRSLGHWLSVSRCLLCAGDDDEVSSSFVSAAAWVTSPRPKETAACGGGRGATRVST